MTVKDFCKKLCQRIFKNDISREGFKFLELSQHDGFAAGVQIKKV